ncbi:MAG: RagB/SusD family nutrient uptake outer membrane protein [Calditrichaeota bacterium]|nr:MAG: RagB/SusD family nutrient uptake outer membrane protein [Calditrichota bacterium]
MNIRHIFKVSYMGSMVILLFLLLAGCHDLDFPNPNAPIVDDVPDQALVSGAEAGMRVDHAIYLRVVGSLGREVYYFEPADPRYTGNLLRGTPDPGGFLVLRPWSGRYAVIRVCNELLNRADQAGGATGAGIRGFAKTIKAYQLLLNLNYMDENGIKIIQSDDINTPFASKTESLNEIVKLLDEANTDLANAGGSFSFELSSGFSGFDSPSTFAKFNRALRARVAAYMEDWQGVLDALNGSFIDPSASLRLGVYHVYGTALNDQTNEIFENPEAPFVKLMAHPSFQTDAEPGDLRFSSKVVVRDLDENNVPDTTVFDDLSSTMGVTITSGSTDPFPIIRNEELLLLRAEANIQLGNLSAAEADINVVRNAAGLGSVTLTDQASAIDQLLHERRYSLFMEGHRWVDMRRYGRLNQLPVDRPGDVVLDKMPRPETELPEG